MPALVRRVAPLALVAGGCLALGASVVVVSVVPALVVPVVVGSLALAVLVRTLIRWDDDPEAASFVARWTVGSFAIHLVVGLAITSSFAAVNYFGGDAQTYDAGARGILGHWLHGLPLPHLPSGKEGYYYLLASLYWVFGTHNVAGLVVNAILAAAIVPIVADTTHRLLGPRAARFAPPVVVLVPGMVLWTSQLLKEAPVLLLLAVAANCGVRMVERVTPGPLLLLMATLGALLTFRGPVGVAAIGGVVLGVALGKRDLTGGVVAAGTVLGAVALAITMGLGTSGYRLTVETDLRTANDIRRDLSISATSGFAETADISSTRGAISYLPRGLAGFALGPFPWELGGARQLLAVPDLLAWYYLIPALWRGLRGAGSAAARRPMVLILPALTITILLSLVISNYGTVVRERMQILVLLTPLVALGLAEIRAKAEAGIEPEPAPALHA